MHISTPPDTSDLQALSAMRVMRRKRYLGVNKQKNLHWRQHAEEVRSVRNHARDLWLGSDMLPQFPAIFVMQTFAPHAAQHIPDTDSQAWLAKRILDGAVDAGVVPDDTPQYVSEVRLLDITRAVSGALDEWFHCAWFEAPC